MLESLEENFETAYLAAMITIVQSLLCLFLSSDTNEGRQVLLTILLSRELRPMSPMGCFVVLVL